MNRFLGLLFFLNILVFGFQWVDGGGRKHVLADELIPKSNEQSRLTLLSEVVVSELKLSMGSGEKNGRMTDGDMCLLIGPIDEEARAEKILQSVIDRGIESRLFKKKVGIAPDYWVYLNPLKNRKAALRRLKELQLRKIDSYLISQGELRNGISLGLFKNINSAKALQKRRNSQGYSTQFKEILREKDKYWIASVREVGAAIMGEIDGMLSYKNKGLEHRQVFCENVASVDKLP